MNHDADGSVPEPFVIRLTSLKLGIAATRVENQAMLSLNHHPLTRKGERPHQLELDDAYSHRSLCGSIIYGAHAGQLGRPCGKVQRCGSFSPEFWLGNQLSFTWHVDHR